MKIIVDAKQKLGHHIEAHHATAMRYLSQN